MKPNWKAKVLECQRAGDHLKSCDDDGYCNACGYQETVKDPKRPDIEADTAILPWVVAETVIQESFAFAPDMMPGEARAAQEHLEAKAAQVYRASEDFRKKIRSNARRGNAGRDNLYMFMRHWLSAWIKDNAPALWPKVPDDFKRGLPLPRRFT
jgi:hypothetical protein